MPGDTSPQSAAQPLHFRKLENMYHSAPINRFFEPRLEVREGRSVLHMKVKSDYYHAANALHGSVYFKALDDAAYFAVASLETQLFVLTASFNIYLIRPVYEGILRAEGVVTSTTTSMFIADAVLYCGDNELVARGSGHFRRSGMRLDHVPSYA